MGIRTRLLVSNEERNEPGRLVLYHTICGWIVSTSKKNGLVGGWWQGGVFALAGESHW
jgi:hypothetical protein